MTPLELTVLLHYYACPTDHPEIANAVTRAPAYQKALDKFITTGYLIACPKHGNGPMYAPTSKLHAYVKALTQVPEPIIQWMVVYD